MKKFEPIPVDIETLAKEVVDAAYKVHSQLGPGLLESAYEACLTHELRKRGRLVESQVLLPIAYDGLKLDAGFRIDLLVEHEIVVELKAVEKTHPLYDAQLLTYLKLANKRLGLLINFNVPLIRDGIRRIIL